MNHQIGSVLAFHSLVKALVFFSGERDDCRPEFLIKMLFGMQLAEVGCALPPRLLPLAVLPRIACTAASGAAL